jgi:PRTRC genetic system protein E
MFRELVPVLRHRAVLMTVTFLDEEQIRVNVVPKKLKDGENEALTTPLSVTGTAEELDSELGPTIVGYVSSHLQLKNTLEKAQAEMDAAGKQIQAEARAKSKAAQTKKELPKAETAKPAPTLAMPIPGKPEPAKTASLFDMPAESPSAAQSASVNTEEEILSEIDEDQGEEDGDELDEAA